MFGCVEAVVLEAPASGGLAPSSSWAACGESEPLAVSPGDPADVEENEEAEEIVVGMDGSVAEGLMAESIGCAVLPAVVAEAAPVAPGLCPVARPTSGLPATGMAGAGT